MYKNACILCTLDQLIRMDDRKRIVFADLQGFIVNKQFVLKELCFSCASEELPKYHFVYEPPFEWKFVSDTCKRRIIWATIFHHGFYWNAGSVPYAQIERTIEALRAPSLIIYVKGSQKVAWLRNLIKDPRIDCRNIEEIGCNFRLSDCASCRLMCGQHKHNAKSCALQTVGLLETWYWNAPWLTT